MHIGPTGILLPAKGMVPTLERLIADGRIQPAKIEKEVEIAEEEIGRIIKNEGEKAAWKV